MRFTFGFAIFIAENFTGVLRTIKLKGYSVISYKKSIIFDDNLPDHIMIKTPRKSEFTKGIIAVDEDQKRKVSKYKAGNELELKSYYLHTRSMRQRTEDRQPGPFRLEYDAILIWRNY